MEPERTATVESLTLEEFGRLPEEDGFRMELVRGRLVREPPAGARHSDVAAAVFRALDAYAQKNEAGKVRFDAGYVLEEEPPTVRIPDVAFIAAHRLPPGPSPTGCWELAPDVAVEVLSPSNRPSAILEKVAQYLEAGVRLVWIADPGRETVTIYRPDGEVGVFGVGDVLRGEDVLPGFRLEVAEVFAD